MEYESIDTRVCHYCVNDKDIKQFIKKQGECLQCDYCERKRVKTTSFDEFIEFFLKHVDDEYGDPLEDYVCEDDGRTFEINELLCDIDVTESERLQDDIVRFLSDKTMV